MKRTRRFLYLFVMAIVVATIAVFAFACGDGDSNATEYTLTFMNGTAVHDTIKGTAGSAVEFNKDEPTRTNLVFDGWSETDGGEVVELPTKMPAENKTYYAVFSVRYTITLNTGSSEELDPVTTKAGTSLYELVSDIVPAANGDATFDAWYYGNNKVDADSTAVMPEMNITLNAKYTVDYVVNVYKQNGISDDDGEATYGSATQISSSGYVGEWVTITPDEGYEPDIEQDNKFVTSPLSSEKSQNTYNVYFNFRKYTIMFNANLPADVVSGEMTNGTALYTQGYNLPACEYEAEGYHFLGWSTTASGKVEYYKDDKFDATRNTTFYAVWSKSLVDSNGQSTDYIFICDNADGSETVSYFERFGFYEVEGTYDEKTGIFVVKNLAGDVLVRGYADIAAGTYTYFAVDGNVYVLSDMQGTITENITLELDDTSDTAYYTVSDNKTTGKYSYDVDSGALKFTSEDVEFFFRLKTFQGNDGDVQAFIIRGDEVGEWDRLEQDGTLKGNYFLSLDGFGGARLYCRDTVSSATATWSALGGVYEVVEESNVDGIEILVVIYGTRARVFYCLLLEGEETNIYLEKTLAYTFTDKSGNGDTLTLDGYGVYADSAEYTKDGVTAKYGYVYDDYMGAVALIDANGEVAYMFELSTETDPNNEEQYIYNFELTEDLFGVWAVLGLSNQAFFNGYIVFEIYNNGNAGFSVMLPLTSTYYGNSYMDYYPVLSGTLEYLEDSDEYVFVGDVDSYTAYVIYSFYAQAGISLNISNWGDIKLAPVYSGDAVIGFSLVAYGDGMGGKTLTYDGVTYTLDGYGYAMGDDESVKTYTVSSTLGAPRLFLTWTEDEIEYSETYIYIDNAFRRYTRVLYSGYNTRSSIGIMLLEGDYAVLFYYNSSTLTMFSWGKVVWSETTVPAEVEVDDETTTYYTYKYATYTESAGMNSMFVPVGAEYDNFKFCVYDYKEGEDGVVESGDWFYVYGGNSVDSNGVSTVTAGGASLAIDTVNKTATYVDTENATYSGSYSYYDDIIVITYIVTDDDETETTTNIYIKVGANSLTVLDSVAGHWLSDNDGASYLELDGMGGAKYHVYNDDGSYTTKNGTYAKSDAARMDDEYTFAAADSSVSFDFIARYSSNIPMFITYATAIGDGTTTYQIYNSTGSGLVGLVKGGGYGYVMLQYGSSTVYYGSVEAVDYSGPYDAYKFTAAFYMTATSSSPVASSAVAYLVYNSSSGIFLMCDDYFDTMFELNTYTAFSTITIASIYFLGHNDAVLLLGTDGKLYGYYYYMQYDETTYLMYGINSSTGNPVPMFLFVLYSNYTADINDGYKGYFGNVNNYTLLNLDGFGNAVYMDTYGIMYYASYTWYDKDNGIICLVYVDEFYNEIELYIQIDEDGYIEIIDPNATASVEAVA